MSKTKINIVTGGLGFIGCHLAEALLRKGERVIIFDVDAGRPEKEWRKKILMDAVQNYSDLIIAKGINSIENLFKVFVELKINKEKHDVIFYHLGALGSIPRSKKAPWATYDRNVTSTSMLLKFMEMEGYEKIIFASSSSVYGKTESRRQEGNSLNPVNDYALSKYTCEKMILNYPVKGFILRLFNVYGPYQDGSDYSGVIGKWCENIRRMEDLQLNGSTDIKRHFTYVGDVVDAMIYFGNKETELLSIVNLGHESESSMGQIMNILGEEASFRVNLKPKREGDVKRAYGSFEKLRGYSQNCTTSIRDGLKKTLNYVMEKG